MKTFVEFASIEELAQHIADSHQNESYTEHEGVVYPNIASAYLIASRVRDFNQRHRLANIPYSELKIRIEKEYTHKRQSAPQILEKILIDKICGCRELCQEFLAHPAEAYQTEFGLTLQKIYKKVKDRSDVRYH